MTRAIPRRLNTKLWPFRYETDADIIRQAIARYDESLGIERRCVARALRTRRDPSGHRRHIDRLEAARRNGLARLRELAK